MNTYTWTGRFGRFASLFVSCALVLSCCQQTSPISLSMTHVDLGTIVADGSATTINIAVSNNTDDSLRIAAKWDCGCTSVVPSHLELPAHSTKSLAIRVSPSTWSNHIDSTVFLKNAGTNTVLGEIPVHGLVAPWLAADRQVVQVVGSELNGTVEHRVEVVNLRAQPFEGVAVLSGDFGEAIRLPAEAVHIGPYGKREIVFAASYRGPQRRRGTLEIRRSRDTNVVLTLPVVCTGIPAIQATPPTAIFSKARKDATIQLSTLNGKAFRIMQVVTGPSVPLQAQWADESAARQDVSLRWNSNRSSQFSGLLTIHALVEDVPIKLSLPVLAAQSS